jgi:type VI secretion system protein
MDLFIKKYSFVIRRIISVMLFLIITGTFFSCGTGIRIRSLLGGRLQVAVKISEDANQNHPVAMDLIFVYDEKLVEELLKLSAKEWLAKRDQVKRDYVEGKGLDIWGWEWTPGQEIPVQELPLNAKTETALIFADYLSPGAHRIRVDPFKDITIRLLKDDVFAESSQE